MTVFNPVDFFGTDIKCDTSVAVIATAGYGSRSKALRKGTVIEFLSDTKVKVQLHGRTVNVISSSSLIVDPLDDAYIN